MLSKLRSSVLIFAALVAGFVLATRGAEAQDGGVGSPATEDFFSGTTHYAVPAKYRPGITRYSEKRNYSALTLMLLLPDFSPAAEHLEELKTPGWRNQMTLLFEHGPRMIDPDAQIAWMTNWPHGVHTSPEPTANECDLYRTPLFSPGDVYACPEDGSKLVLSCDRKSDVPFPACTVFENISPDLSLIYHYSAKYSSNAVSIDRRVRALISSFIRPQPPTDR